MDTPLTFFLVETKEPDKWHTRQNVRKYGFPFKKIKSDTGVFNAIPHRQFNLARNGLPISGGGCPKCDMCACATRCKSDVYFMSNGKQAAAYIWKRVVGIKNNGKKTQRSIGKYG